MTPAIAGWIVLGVLCAASLVLMLLGALYVMSAQRDLKAKLARLEATQRRRIDPDRLSAASARITGDIESAVVLFERARRAVSTIVIALRYFAVAIRIVKLLT